MAGGLMQLVAYGAQDVPLTTNPEITFFQLEHQRYTNFSIESIEQTFTGSVGFGKKVQCSLGRTGDLVNRMYLQVTLPALARQTLLGATRAQETRFSALQTFAWTNSVGHAMIDEVSIDIGGTQIARHYGQWLEIAQELSCPRDKQDGLYEMIGKYASDVGLQGNATRPRTYYIPLLFWFCKNPGLSLPLIALQYHEVRVQITFRPLNDLVVALTASGDRWFPSGTNTAPVLADSSVEMSDCGLWVDYVYLDNEERKRFSQEEHKYLVEQLQYHGMDTINSFQTSTQRRMRLNLNHPTKELVWVLRTSANNTGGVSYNDWFNFSANTPGSKNPNYSVDLLGTAQLRLNGHDRFAKRNASYFRLVQPFQHHTRVPSKHIYCYSFALKPEEFQPSGTCNFSRIDAAHLDYTTAAPDTLPGGSTSEYWKNQTGIAELYAVSYNSLRIEGGLAGLSFAN